MAGLIETGGSLGLIPEGQRATKIENPLQVLTEKHRVWWGSDLRCVDIATIRPGRTTMVDLSLTDECLPFKIEDLSDEALRTLAIELDISMRSRLAQSGLRIDKNRARSIDINERTLRLGIMGLGDRAVEIPREFGVGCLFSTIGANFLAGEDLYEAANLVIGGEFTRDWKLVVGRETSDSIENVRAAWGIALKLSPERFKIGHGGILRLGNKPNYRDFLDRHVLRPVEAKEQPSFYVGRTKATLNLPLEWEIVGELWPAAFIDGQWIEQIDSRLLKPGQTEDWPIRVELYDPHDKLVRQQRTAPAHKKGQGTQYVILRLIKQPGFQQPAEAASA